MGDLAAILCVFAPVAVLLGFNWWLGWNEVRLRLSKEKSNRN